MSQALREKIQELYENTKDLKSFNELQPFCDEFNEWLKENTNYSTAGLGTALSKYGFGKLFKSIPLEQGKNAQLIAKHDASGKVTGQELKHYVILSCGLSKEQWEERNKTSRVSDRLTTTDESGNIGIEIKPNDYIEIVSKLLECGDPHELAVGLIAATGRRPHEILARAKFTPVSGKSYEIMFEGQGKKRGEKPVFKIPVLFPAKYLNQRLRVLRKDTEILLLEAEKEFPGDIVAQNKSIEDRRGNSLRRIVQKYFGGKDDKEPLLNFRTGDDQNDCKALRAACAALITERECKGSIGAKMLFAAKFLGHITEVEKPTDRDLQHIATSIGYMDYYVTEPVNYPTAPMKNIGNVKALDSDLAIIKDLAERWDCPQHEVMRRLLDTVDETERLRKLLLEAENKIAELTDNNNNESKNTDMRKLTIKDIDVTTLDSEDLKTRKSPEAVEEKINRAFQAMTRHNNEIATDNKARWYIGNTSLRELSGCNGLLVKAWLERHELLVNDHNNKFGLGQYHNKGKGNISAAIKW